MNLFILGATGAIGKHLLDSALERGHQVTSYVRSPQKIHLTHECLKVVRGSVFDADQMAHSLTGHDIILSAFGPTTARSSTLPYLVESWPAARVASQTSRKGAAGPGRSAASPGPCRPRN